MARAKGPDISTWQRSDNVPGEPNTDLLTDDADFLIAKRGQNNRIDVDFDFWYSRIHGKIPMSDYLFGEYDHYAAPQAKWYIDQRKVKPMDFRGTFDVEPYKRFDVSSQLWVPVPLPPAYNLVQWIFDFGDPYKEEFKEWPMLYINGSLAIYIKGSGHKRLNELKEWPLWLSYPGAEQIIYDSGYLGIWNKWTLWQYSWTINGYAHGVETKELDYNYFNGTNEDFLKWANISQTPPIVTPPTPQPIDIIAELNAITKAVADIKIKMTV